jgi:hypothetical protein
MLGSFIKQGVTAEEARSEIVLQMYVLSFPKFKLGLNWREAQYWWL